MDRAVETSTDLRRTQRERLLQCLRAGEPLEDALKHAAPDVAELDRQLIAAGVTSGRLPEVFRRLAQRQAETAAAGGRALLAALYPVGVAHLAVVLFPIKLALVDGDLAGYGWSVLRVLLPAWALAGGLLLLVRLRFRPALAALNLVPLVRGYRQARAVADLAFALEAQLVAGIRLDIAWLQAAMAAGDPRLETIAVRVAETVQQGNPASPALVGRRELPPPFAAFWQTGESTGRLDESMKHAHRHFADIASRKLMLASLVYPKVLFIAIAIWVALQIIAFYAGYFQQFEELM